MKKVCVLVLLATAMSCGSVSEEDIQPIQVEEPKTECFGEGCEDPVRPPCYPNC